MDLRIFNVEHGACALLTTDAGHRLVIDCGHNATTGWYPGEYLAGQGIGGLDALCVSLQLRPGPRLRLRQSRGSGADRDALSEHLSRARGDWAAEVGRRHRQHGDDALCAAHQPRVRAAEVGDLADCQIPLAFLEAALGFNETDDRRHPLQLPLELRQLLEEALLDTDKTNH
jgi:hypothetical protein